MAQRKLIITLHLNGPTRASSPHLPYSPEEIADQAVECSRQGAAIVHYHACDPETGAPSRETAAFADIQRRIKKACNIITFPTLGGLVAEPAGRLAHILEIAKDPATRPDCIPLDMLTTNLDAYDAKKKEFTSLDRIYSNTTRNLIDIVQRVSAVGVKPVPMFWNVAGVRVAEKFVEMGILKEPMYCNVSIYGEPYLGFGHPATGRGLDAIVDFFPPNADWRWSSCVVAANGLAVLAHAIERGGDVTIGLHDYTYPELGFPTNAELIARVADLARAMGREVATAAEAREILGFE